MRRSIWLFTTSTTKFSNRNRNAAELDFDRRWVWFEICGIRFTACETTIKKDGFDILVRPLGKEGREADTVLTTLFGQ